MEQQTKSKSRATRAETPTEGRSAAGPRHEQLSALSATLNAAPQVQRLAAMNPSPVQRAAKHGGLPDALKAGVESLSGMSMDHVKVHYDSPAPAQLQAHAYAQGSDIHLAPGQEKHLPHEAWHVVQQAQGRVQPTRQMMTEGLAVNDSQGLEHEADVMGEKALGMGTALVQRAAAAGSPADAPTQLRSAPPGQAAGTSVLQARWLTIASSYFWEEDGTQRTPVPHEFSAFKEIAPLKPGSYYVNNGRRDKPLAFSLDHYRQINGKQSSRTASDVYNPFGRFDSAGTISAFIPSSWLLEDGGQGVLESLSAKDGSFKAITNYSDRLVNGYPDRVRVEGGEILHLSNVSQLGATYSNVVMGTDRATQIREAGNAADLGLRTAPSDELKEARNSSIDKESIEYWSGRDRSEDQKAVMGASAGEVAANAGYDAKEGKGWEWLHLIAHSMGGIETIGPQVAGNLVVGTSECNTQMIIVEEFLKDVVTRYKLRGRLHVMARMIDRERHIADRIGYDFIVYAPDGEHLVVFHWEFDPLSRTQPLVQENRTSRYVGRLLFGDGKDFKKPARKPKVDMPDKPNQLEPDELRLLVSFMTEEQQIELAQLLDLSGDMAGLQALLPTLELLHSSVLMKIGAALKEEGDKDRDGYAQAVNANLEEIGYRRGSADGFEFVCLVDSIHQLLAHHGIAINRELLIQRVREATGTDAWEMLDITGDQGHEVLRAVEHAIFESTGHHLQLVADVFMTMPNGSVVPFYHANTYTSPEGGETLYLDLLYINQNHYEPLFEE